MRNKDFEIWMIRMKGDPTSEIYAKYCARSWTDAGFHVNFFDAVTPETLPNYYHRIKFPDKSITEGTSSEQNDQERSCLLSQILLWEKCVEINKPILVLEHDAFLENPEAIIYNPFVDVTYFSQHCMEAVLFQPSFCKDFLKWIKQIRAGVMKDGRIVKFDGPSSGPFALLETFLGNNPDENYFKYHKKPHTRYLGLTAPVKDIIIDELGSTIDHSRGKGKTSDNKDRTNYFRGNPFKVISLNDVYEKK